MNEDINILHKYSQPCAEEKVPDQSVSSDWKKDSRPLVSGVVADHLALMSLAVSQERGARR